MKNLYLIAILPPEELSEQIDEIRNECSLKYKVFKALKPPVHITLFRPFFLDSEREDWFLKQLATATRHKPFIQELENFDSFNNKTLFIRAEKSPALAALQKDVARVMNSNKIDPREVKGNTLFKPHVTIAYRDILPEFFPVMWAEYKNRKFKRSFAVENFTLLKHDGENWRVLKEFLIEKEDVLTLF